MIAVIETGGKQYLVREGDVLKVEKLDVEAGEKMTFDKVLLTSKEDGADTKIGTPYLSGVSIDAEVLSNGRDRKVRVVKYKNKIRYKRVYGHRQHFTEVKIGKIA